MGDTRAAMHSRNASYLELNGGFEMKKSNYFAPVLLTATILGSSGTVYADERSPDFGQRVYLANCAVCHGKQGKGDGPFAGVLDTRVADLTTLAKQNGGVFPFARVYEIIDGEQVVKAHGPRDMPIWGTEFRIRGAENYGEFPYDADAYVRARILALAEYVYRLQAK